MTSRRLLFAIISWQLFYFASCSTTRAPVHAPSPSSVFDASGNPDYSKLVNWAAHPAKSNPSDSIPRPLQASSIHDSSVDVFFLYPTSLTNLKDTAWNADLSDTALNAKTDMSSILYQASAFNEFRVFAPRYRQAHLRAYYTPDTAIALRAFDLAYNDLRSAFQYYLSHFNSGRPIIIASHSQGSTHAQRLLREFFDGKPLQKKLVAAYVIGMAIPKNTFSSLQPCRDSAQTGCLVGWRSFKEGYEPEFVQKENGNSIVTNPLSWTLTNEYAPRDLNHGAVLKKFNSVVAKVADAQIHDDIIWISKLHFPGSMFYRTKNYHVGDINLFYVNIRENLRTRVSAYRKN